MTTAVEDAAERAARTSYGRLVALLAGPTGDLELAEETLAHAFEQALTTWPINGVPDNPEGWLLTVARNRQRDVWKSAHRRRSVPLQALVGTSADPGPALEDLDIDAIPDRRLALLFVCGHPAIAGNARTPLMLQTVLGFDSAQIARAFAMPAAAMQQRLVRAKRRIRQAHIPFDVPGRSVMAERLPAVLEAVYGCYALTTPGGEQADSLSAEARYLAITIASMLEDEPEAWSLAALLTLATARGRNADSFQPLEEQDPATWDLNLILEGEGYLHRAECPGRALGRFQLEAAIQAVHCDRVRGTRTNWAALSTLYAALVAIAPTLGSRVAQAAVVARTETPAAALRLLDALPPECQRFQPYHATRADLLARAGHDVDAADAYRTAATLTEEPATARFLWDRADVLDPERSRP